MIENSGESLLYSELESSKRNFISIKDSQATLPRWGDEKTNLISIMDKNEKIVNLSQMSLAKEKQNMIKEFKNTENLYKNIIQEQESLVSIKLAENIRENALLKEKIKKIEQFHLQKEEKLTKELNQIKSNYEKLENDFNKKLSQISDRALISKKTSNITNITQEQLNSLMSQKKLADECFIQEKNRLLKEISKQNKTISQLNKELAYEKELQTRMEYGFKNDIQSLINDIENANSKIDSLMDEVDQRENNYNEKISELNQIFDEREGEFFKTLQEFQDEFNDYKEHMELTAQKNEKSLKIEDFRSELKIISKNLEQNRDNLGQKLDDIKEILQYSTDHFKIIAYSPRSNNNHKDSELTILLENIKNLMKVIKNNKAVMEKLQNELSAYFEAHQIEIINKENENLKKLYLLSNENAEMQQKLLEINKNKPFEIRLKKNSKKKLEDEECFEEEEKNDEKDKIIADLAQQNQVLIGKLKKKLISNEKKQRCELDAWELREEIYKKAIKNISEQIGSINSQLKEAKRLKNSSNELKIKQLSQLNEELISKDSEISYFKQELASHQADFIKERENFQEGLIRFQKFNSEIHQLLQLIEISADQCSL